MNNRKMKWLILFVGAYNCSATADVFLQNIFAERLHVSIDPVKMTRFCGRNKRTSFSLEAGESKNLNIPSACGKLKIEVRDAGSNLLPSPYQGIINIPADGDITILLDIDNASIQEGVPTGYVPPKPPQPIKEAKFIDIKKKVVSQ